LDCGRTAFGVDAVGVPAGSTIAAVQEVFLLEAGAGDNTNYTAPGGWVGYSGHAAPDYYSSGGNYLSIAPNTTVPYAFFLMPLLQNPVTLADWVLTDFGAGGLQFGSIWAAGMNYGYINVAQVVVEILVPTAGAAPRLASHATPAGWDSGHALFAQLPSDGGHCPVHVQHHLRIDAAGMMFDPRRAPYRPPTFSIGVPYPLTIQVTDSVGPLHRWIARSRLLPWSSRSPSVV